MIPGVIYHRFHCQYKVMVFIKEIHFSWVRYAQNQVLGVSSEGSFRYISVCCPPQTRSDLSDERGPLLRLLGELCVELVDLRESVRERQCLGWFLQVLNVHLQRCQT